MKSLKQRLTSRKFWLAIFGLGAALVMGVYGILTNQQQLVDAAVSLAIVSIGSFLAAEGASDALVGYQAQKRQIAEIEYSMQLARLGYLPVTPIGNLVPGTVATPSPDNPITSPASPDSPTNQDAVWIDGGKPSVPTTPADGTPLMPGSPR